MTIDHGLGAEPILTLLDESAAFVEPDDDDEEWVCGISREHVWSEGSVTCRECDADLSSWMEDGDDRDDY